MANDNQGLLIPTTQIWDISEIESVNVNSREFKELLIRLYQNLNRMAVAINLKDSAIYDNSEFINGQSFFPNPAYSSMTATRPSRRSVYRTVVNFGALPNAAAKSVPHYIDIDSGYTFTRIYGAASRNKPGAYIYFPIPYVSLVLNEQIQLYVTDTDVVITTAIDYSLCTTCYVILEYIKQ